MITEEKVHLGNLEAPKEVFKKVSANIVIIIEIRYTALARDKNRIRSTLSIIRKAISY